MSIPDFAADAEALEAAVRPAQVQESLAKGAAELVRLEQDLRAKENAFEEAKKAFGEYRHKTLPALFQAANCDSFGVPGAEVDVVVAPYYQASIAAEWGEDRRRAAFAHLAELGGEALVRTGVTVYFTPKDNMPAGETADSLAKQLREYIERWNLLDGRAVTMATAVPWQTLTSFVREWHESPPAKPTDMPEEEWDPGPNMKLDILGAVVGMVAKVVKRKAPGKKRRG